MTESSINRAQANIMRRLFEQDGLRFAQINSDKIPTDQFSYHLRQLMRVGLIEKLSDNTYRLTTKGRSKNIMLHPTKSEYIEQGFTAVLSIAAKRENGQTYYLMQQRDKVPYQGTISGPGDKIYYGESVADAARRALHVQTGLSGDPELRSIWHLMEIYEDEIVQDKYFYVHIAQNCTGEVKEYGITGKNVWMSDDEIQKSDQLIYSAADIIKSVQTPELSFHEITAVVESY